MPRPLIPDRRGRVLAAARELILERGWPAVTVADIAARSGIGKGAVYLEFPDKPAILDAVLNRSMRRLTAAVHRRVLDEPGVVDLPTAYRFGIEALLGEPLMRALSLGDREVLGEHVRGVSDDRYPQRMGWLGDYIAGLQEARVIDPAVSVDAVVRVLSLFTLGLLHAPGTLGATTVEELTGAVELFAGLVGRGLTADMPADPEKARAAQLSLIEHLESQLDALEESP